MINSWERFFICYDLIDPNVIDLTLKANQRVTGSLDFPRDKIEVELPAPARAEEAASPGATGAEEELIAVRRQILDAAVRVFARQGFHACRVSDIADEAGVARFAELNSRFHLVLARAARSPRLEAMLLRMLQAPLVLLKRYRLNESVGIDRSNRQHREIIAALRAGNAEWAALAVGAHLVSTVPDFAETETGAPDPRGRPEA